MIGNDVVDLGLAKIQSNWERRGFLEKVFTDSEQKILFKLGDKNRFVWILWSMKEAAYKAHQRSYDLPRQLNWKGQECSLIFCGKSKVEGRVQIGKEKYFTISSIAQERVFTWAFQKDGLDIQNFLNRGSMEETKNKLIEVFADRFYLPKRNLSISKNNNGVPFLSFGKKEIFSSFSFSGHGKFTCFSLSLMKS